MIEWEVAADSLRIVDTDTTELLVSGDLGDVRSTDAEIQRPVDAVIEATASELRFPHAVVYVRSLETGTQHELDPAGRSLELPSGEYLIDVDTEIKTYVRVDGGLRIERTPDYESVVVSLDRSTSLLLGFRSRHEFPAGTITIPETPPGLARAISYLSSSHKTQGPDRSYPTLRGHPPLLELGDSFDVPESIATHRPAPGVELLVPEAFDAIFVTAPLAYYVQASVRTAAVDRPHLRLPEQDRELALSPLPDLERDVERLLRKIFFLDCLVRNVGPYGTNLTELRLLDALDLETERLYAAEPADRLDAYLDVPYEALEHRLPEWHLSMYVDPDPAQADVLPFLLDRMGLCFLPRTSALEGQELVERSLDDFYRGDTASNLSGGDEPGQPAADGTNPAPTSARDDTGSTAGGGDAAGPTAADGGGYRSAGEVASVDIVKPELRSGKTHGWLAAGVPIDVFKSSPQAYYNRLEFLDTPSDETVIYVILNDPEMAGEHADVYDIYRNRSEDLSMDVRVREGCSTEDLRSIFESNVDFVHYIGHCEQEGLRCPDGYFSTATLEDCNVETFFLNACGSFHEGRTLVERGSVAGAVTFTQVLNDHAVKVGSTFAKLLVNGFGFERAMGLARRRIMMGKDYAVVGDGTHTLTQGEHRTPTTITLEALDDADRYLLTLSCYSSQLTGSYYFPHTPGNEYASLCGNESNFVLDRDELVTFLAESEAPVIYDGDLYWSQDLWPKLTE
ncbi:hypothetical protein [Halovivax limisalsi]|uniref:hypothetical protein n=1 Tax=Halovivax limisalsi TaxID=1453760 RepID=UPI001FFD8CF1|nr:hypothetical protein [Halovivax limisalsi]